MDNLLNLREQHFKYEVTGNESLKDFLDLIENNFHKGQKSIAFGSTHYKNSQEKSIILACDFFNKKFPALKILVITFELKRGVFSDFIEESKKGENYFYEFSPNLTFFNWQDFLTKKIEPKEVVDVFDVVFWDLPEITFINEREKELRSSFASMDGLYIVSLKNNKFDDENFKREIMHYYKDHGLDIRTILPWKFGERKRRPRSKFSRLIYGLFRR
jgi:hypothetical protein